MALLTYNDLQEHANLDLESDGQSVVNLLATDVQAWAESRCGYPFEAQTITEYFDYNETPFRLGTEAPVSNISVSLFDPNLADYTPFTGTIRLLRYNTLQLIPTGPWPVIYPAWGEGFGTGYEAANPGAFPGTSVGFGYDAVYRRRYAIPDAVQVDYTAGWTSDTVPADLKGALLELLTLKFWAAQNQEQGQLFEVKVGAYMERYAPTLTGKGMSGLQVPDTVAEVIDRYTRPARV